LLRNFSQLKNCTEKRRILSMHQSHLSGVVRSFLVVIGLLVIPLAVPTFAQSGSGSTGGGAPAQTNSTTTTTTTKSTTPTETTRTTTTTSVDPMWIALGAVALLALLAIAFLAMRGRSRDRVATVQERETVIKKE
jgi:beta-lactamase regulating signal transducer with metallopeptidase domain